MRVILGLPLALALAGVAEAATVQHIARFDDFLAVTAIGGGNPVNRTRRYDLGFAEVELQGLVTGGLAAVSAEAEIHARHEDRLSLEAGRRAEVMLEARSLSGAFGLSSEVAVSAMVDFRPMIPLGDPAPYALAPVALETFDSDTASRSGFVSTYDTDPFWIDDFASPVTGILSRLELSGDLIQLSSMTFRGLRGSLVATHETGLARRAGFSLGRGELTTSLLDLSQPGTWRLALEDVTIETSDIWAALDLSLEQGTFGYGIPIQGFAQPGFCGDFGSDGDNFFQTPIPISACLRDEERSLEDSVLSLHFGMIKPSLGFRRADLGTITVAPPAPVPLPATLPLLGAALATLRLLARRKRRSNAAGR